MLKKEGFFAKINTYSRVYTEKNIAAGAFTKGYADPPFNLMMKMRRKKTRFILSL